MADLRCVLRNIPSLSIKGRGEANISGVSTDSRNINSGEVFIALAGMETDGHRYIEDAVAKGAQAVVVDKDMSFHDISLSVPVVRVENTRAILPAILENVYGKLFSDTVVYGVTGTNGKTTTTFFLEHVLRKAGLKIARFGTVGHSICGEWHEASHTTPDVVGLYKLFFEAKKKGVDAVVMEVSSHAICQGRIDNIKFDFGVFTNLSRDHLDYHRGMESYFEAKASFFTDYLYSSKFSQENPGCAINIDCSFGRRLYEKLHMRGFPGLVTYGIYSRDALFRILDMHLGKHGASFSLSNGKQVVNIEIKLIGEANVYNALATFAAAMLGGIPEDVIVSGIGEVTGAPGRYEFVREGQSFSIIVDYAHTPDALGSLLKDIRRYTPNGKIITVFGCGGNRDTGKRFMMGTVAAVNSDFVVITSDNPRWENAMDIAHQVEEGIVRQINTGPGSTGSAYTVCIDRKEAIRMALHKARPGDCVVVAGKGHEQYQEIKGIKYPFCDSEVIRQFL